MSRFGRRCGAIALGLLVDRALGEPPARVHPVVGFGTLMGRIEQRVWSDRRLTGVAYAASGVAVGALAGRLAGNTAVPVAGAVAGRELRRVAGDIGTVLARGDLDGARAALPALVGRDPSSLDASGVAAAIVESVAENSVDAVVAPVVWAVVAGAPGVAAYRAVNTMDAMVGHRNERFGNFGWAAARADDVANWIPARIFAGLLMIQAPAEISRIAALVRRDARAHPSPNGGVAETAMAAMLGRELGGPLRYGEIEEDRPRLGDGPRPDPADIDRAIAISDRAELFLVTILATAWIVDRLRRLRRP